MVGQGSITAIGQELTLNSRFPNVCRQDSPHSPSSPSSPTSISRLKAGGRFDVRAGSVRAPPAAPRERPSTRLLRSCDADPKKANARVSRCFRRLHAYGLIAKIPRRRRWRVTNYGRNVMGTSLHLREHHVPNAYSGVVH